MQEIDLNKKIHNLTTISYASNFVLVPEDYNYEIKEDIKAALAKAYLGYSSVDYVRKLFQSPKKKNRKYLSFLERSTNHTWKIFTELIDELKLIKFHDENDITLNLSAIHIRLQNSYEVAIFLIKNQFYFESITVIRMIFEQINYCCNLSKLEQSDFENLNSKSISKKLKSTNIHYFKSLLPESELGSFYSHLSEITHLDFKVVTEYLNYKKEDNEYYLNLKSISQPSYAALLLFKVLDLNCLVFEFTMRKYSSIKTKYIGKDEKKIKALKNRKTRKIHDRLIIEYKQIIANEENHPIQTRKFKREKSDPDLPF